MGWRGVARWRAASRSSGDWCFQKIPVLVDRIYWLGIHRVRPGSEDQYWAFSFDREICMIVQE